MTHQLTLAVIFSLLVAVSAGANLAAALFLRDQISVVHQLSQVLSVEVEQFASGRPELGDLAPQTPCIGTRLDEAVADLKTQVVAITRALGELEVVNANARRAGLAQVFAPPPPLGSPGSPDPAVEQLEPALAPTASLLEWRDSVPQQTVDLVDGLFEQHSSELRERIAAETDPEHPDPTVVIRAMQESREGLSELLRDILPREEHSRLFPELRMPSGD